MKTQDPSSLSARAGVMYEAYCAAVGGKAFNGDALPSWEDFRADPLKEKQSEAWISAASAALTMGAPGDGVFLISKERDRQLGELGMTAVGDDLYLEAELGRAAESCLSTANTQVMRNITKLPPCFIHKLWPWSGEWWKPSDDPVRNLVRAGALIAAEIDRITRARAMRARSRDVNVENLAFAPDAPKCSVCGRVVMEGEAKRGTCYCGAPL